ncbi:PPOX class F420-dependent oxidoreductase [Streptosporangium sp. NPDC048047]|uniref:PPOX class F420-dependent oxidoreductase n=1 Tax=Streptosporangium sp. NPDC048047 TaxID=3155748 RepID=UPI003436CC50
MNPRDDARPGGGANIRDPGPGADAGPGTDAASGADPGPGSDPAPGTDTDRDGADPAPLPALTAGEIAYIIARRLGRLATVAPDGSPQVNPVSCYHNPATGTLDIGGHAMAASRKYRNVRENPRVAVVIDDMPAGVESIRCLEIRGTAEAVDAPADSAARVPGAIIRIRPRRIISWGIDPPHLSRGARSVPGT